jgi:ElaB/YqjD/DUF883 family membrane-anchored ribosome-binding protein
MDQAQGTAEKFYGQAKDAASDAAEGVRKTASSFEDMVRHTIENKPYTAVAIALGLAGCSAERLARYRLTTQEKEAPVPDGQLAPLTHMRETMFHHRSTEFEPRISAIAGHLRAIEKELGGMGKSAGRRASSSASAAGNQIADVIGPILSEIVDRFRRGQSLAVDEATSFGNEAVKTGARLGNERSAARIASEAKHRPLVTLAVAIGVGVLIGIAGRRE